jgi:hypothetical protein
VGIIGVYIVWKLMLSGGGGGQQSYVAQGPSDAQVAAAAQVQMAQIAASTHSQDTAAAVTVAGLQTKNAVDLATIAAGIEGQKVDASKVVSLATLDVQKALGMGQLANQALDITTSGQIQMQGLANQAAAVKQQLRNEYDKNAWDYYITQTAGMRASDTQNLQIQSNTAIMNSLLQMLGQKAA